MKKILLEELIGGQKKLDVAEPKGKLTAADFNALRSKGPVKEEDHEVSMAQSSLESIIKSAMELKAKLGDNERNIPGWIQDHITNAENYIDQAAQGFHEIESDEEPTDMSLTSMMEDLLEQKKKGIYYYINKKHKEGRPPARKGSKAYKKAVKAVRDTNKATKK